MGKEGPKDRLEMSFKRANLGKEGPPTWAGRS